MTLLVCLILPFGNCYSAAEQEITFEILDVGDVSGYVEESYLVVKSEVDWVNVWKKHALIREPPEQPPEIDFTKNFVICAFMGTRPTTGYSINVEKVWTDGEKVFVEVVKRCPPEGMVVCQMLTCPYVMVLVERTEMHFVFHVANENGNVVEYVLSEFPSAINAVLLFGAIFVMATLLAKMRFSKK